MYKYIINKISLMCDCNILKLYSRRILIALIAFLAFGFIYDGVEVYSDNNSTAYICWAAGGLLITIILCLMKGVCCDANHQGTDTPYHGI